MKLSFLYEQKIIIVKEKGDREENIQKISDIFCVSLEKYKYYLEFIKEDKNNKNENEINNLKNQDSKNIKNDNNSNVFINEKQNKIKI